MLPDPVIGEHRLLAVLSALILGAATLVLAAPPSQAGGKTVTIGDTLSPKRLTVTPGTTVTWVNKDDERHRVRSEHDRDALEFDSGNLEPGERWSYTFRATGKASYHDHENDEDRAYFGTVTVERAGSAGGSGGGSGGGGQQAPAKATVSIGENFGPRTVTVRVGGTVTWTNNDDEAHTATGDGFDSGNLNPGQTYSQTFRSAGTYDYVCSYHPDMTGAVRVVNASGQAPPRGDAGVAAGGGGGDGGHAVARHAGGRSADHGGGPSGARSGTQGTGAAAPGAESHTIVISGNEYDPDPLQARVGDEVTWVNEDPVPHTVTGGPWDEMIQPGARFTTVLTEAGTIDYVCTLHPGMGGTLQVKPAPPGTDVPPASRSSSSSGASGSITSGSGGGGHAGHGGQHGTPSARPESGAKNHVVNIVDFRYEPETLEAHVGDTVTFVNKDSAPHTATATDDSFDSGNLDSGDRWTLKLETTGTFEYLCTYHPDMTGRLVVKPKDEKITPAPATSDASGSGGSETTMGTSASHIAGFSSGWLALLAFLAGLQLQSRFAARRPSRVGARGGTPKDN